MAVAGIPYKFKDASLYTSDFGATANFNLSLRPPSDLSDDNINKILDCINAEQRDSGKTICSERGAITYRRLIFYRSNGGSMTVAAPKREDIITQAECIWKILASTSIKPVCVKLVGEKHGNVIDDLLEGDRDGNAEGNPIKPPDDAGRNRFFFSGSMKAYRSDAKFGAQLTQGFKMDTDKDNELYSSLKDEIEGCIGDLFDQSICGGSANSREARKYVVTLLTKANNQQQNEPTEAQTITIPVANNSAEEITKCGQALAKKQFVQCLEYMGESNSRLHKTLTL